MANLKKIKVLCVFSRVLGGGTFSALLDEFLASKSNLQCDHLDFFESDYQIKTGYILENLSSGISVAAKMKQKLRASSIKTESYDLLFFQSHRLCVPFLKNIKRTPTIVALDATPKSAHRGNVQAYSWTARLKAAIAVLLDFCWYIPIFQHVDFFLARTEIVKTSLIEDYGITAEKIAVTYSPMSIAEKAGTGPTSEKPRLIFVGNDFQRKGGPFLIELFSKYLQSQTTLTIVSKDPTLKNQAWPTGVTFIPGLPRSELLALYTECDLFIMPTWKDEGGIAICEAVSAGLPVIVRDTASQHEMVDDGSTGYLLPYQSSEQQWSAAILKLVTDPELRASFGKNALLKARHLFDRPIFLEKLDLALHKALPSHFAFRSGQR